MISLIPCLNGYFKFLLCLSYKTVTNHYNSAHSLGTHLRFEIVYTILGPIIVQCLRGYVFVNGHKSLNDNCLSLNCFNHLQILNTGYVKDLYCINDI